MLEKIPKYPDIPENLRIAAAKKELVPFISVGVSRLAGYPGWNNTLGDRSHIAHAKIMSMK